jgi:GWxTD domain-containing protein
VRFIRIGLGLSLGLMCLTACYYYRLEQKLTSIHKDWLERVEYIIFSEERKLFLNLSDDEKEAFKEEFWIKRDPDPTTEENEFRLEYEARLEEADGLFRGEARSGYRTDRGRIYILYGPPTDQISTPPDDAGRTNEIWYYGNFPVVFVDEFSTGRYSLFTFDLSPLRDLNIKYMHELGRTPGQAEIASPAPQNSLDFDWKVRFEAVGSERVEGEVEITIPLLYVWFAAEGEKMGTVLDLRLEVRDSDDSVIWEKEQVISLEFEEAELKKNPNMKHRLAVPLRIEGPSRRFRQGSYRIFAVLFNRTGEARARKAKTFRLD